MNMKHAYNAKAFLDIPHCFLWIGPYGFVSSHALGLVLDRGFMVGQIDIICRSYCLFAWPNPKFLNQIPLFLIKITCSQVSVLNYSPSQL